MMVTRDRTALTSGNKLSGYCHVVIRDIVRNSVVSGLDLAHNSRSTTKGSSNRMNMFMTMDSKRMAMMSNRPTIDKKLLHGIKQFNLDPAKGLEILEERGYIKMEPQSLASFLLNQERLSKKQIGELMV